MRFPGRQASRAETRGSEVNITEIRVRLTGDPRNKLKAYCSIISIPAPCNPLCYRSLRLALGRTSGSSWKGVRNAVEGAASS